MAVRASMPRSVARCSSCDSFRYEHASLVLTSNLVFSRWSEVFSGATVASAMIDRIVHYAEVLNVTEAATCSGTRQEPASAP
ncbi:ATP-binding protein [Pseudarthrobacter sulfonivorans]|uniref:ATP-binding protein n=1 Tax=Pseudarthrobacter sulfonivorans TaxID=121292 RepID=UPI00286B8EA8|nr:ATP-binding protein [Pseudarthrobacter sulfonivorans]